MLPELREKIETAARDSGRSMNAEVVNRLEASFSGEASDQADKAPQPVLNAQLTLQHASLRLAEVACELLESELPKAKNSGTFRALQNAIAAGLLTTPEDVHRSTEQSITTAAEALEKLRDAADRLGSLK